VTAKRDTSTVSFAWGRILKSSFLVPCRAMLALLGRCSSRQTATMHVRKRGVTKTQLVTSDEVGKNGFVSQISIIYYPS